MGAEQPALSPENQFVHVFHPSARKGAPAIVLLHGTGGDENDLIPLGRALDPDAALLGIRGQILENGMPRFFRRIAPGVLDEDDLRSRAGYLANFLRHCSARYGFSLSSATAVGFSNGANIALALLWDHPEVIQRAVLFRAMLPYRKRSPAPQQGARVLLCEGELDTMVGRSHVDQVVTKLTDAGAHVTVRWQDAAHNLTPNDVTDSRAWLRELR